MHRDAEEHLKTWYRRPKRKPLVLRGARQVGKTSLVRQFAAAEGLLLHEVNLERHPELKRAFASLRTETILAEIEAIVRHPVREAGGLLFLDEIQAVPEAIPALRYLAEDRPGLPVAAAGSLLEFALAKHNFSMPVGRIAYLHLGPMDFREYARERESDLLRYLDAEAVLAGIPEAAHARLLRLLREYLAVGGMPEAVLAMSETGSPREASEVQTQILQTYRDDFAKYATARQLALLQSLFAGLPGQVGRKAKYVNFSREDPGRDVKAGLELLRKAKIFAAVRHSAGNGLPLAAEESATAWKPLFLDVGLMNKAAGLDAAAIARMDAIRLVNEGAIAEQFAGQHLLALGGPSEEPALHYWLREGRSNNAEVDYLVAHGGTVVPVEVKAGAGGSLRSLGQFMKEKGARPAIRFDLNQASRQTERTDPALGIPPYELVSLPLYAVAVLRDVLPRVAGLA